MDELLDEADRSRVRIGVADRQDIEVAREAHASIQARPPRGIESHDSNQTQGVGRAVMHSTERREGMRERMGRAQILLERDGAHGGGDQHPASRLEVGSIPNRTGQ